MMRQALLQHLIGSVVTEFHSAPLTEQQKRNVLVGTLEDKLPPTQHQSLGMLEGPDQFNNEPQSAKAPFEVNNGNDLQKLPVVPIQSTMRGRSNIQPLSDTQNQPKMVSLNNKEEQELNLLELDDQYYAVELSRGGR